MNTKELAHLIVPLAVVALLLALSLGLHHDAPPPRPWPRLDPATSTIPYEELTP